jgi:hypothetical protein
MLNILKPSSLLPSASYLLPPASCLTPTIDIYADLLNL